MAIERCVNCGAFVDQDYDCEGDYIGLDFYCGSCFESMQEAECEMSWYRDAYPMQMGRERDGCFRENT